MSCVPEETRIHRISRILATDQDVRLYPMRWSVPAIDGGFLNAVALAGCALSKLALDPPSVVFATGPRFANFVAGRWLADAFRARLVLQYRDEWTVNTPTFVQTGADDRSEEVKCLARADLVSFVSDGKRRLYQEAFALDGAKLIAVPNGWEPYFHQRARFDTGHLRAAGNHFTLTYTGRWHASLASVLDAASAALRKRPQRSAPLRLVIMGNQTAENTARMAQFAEHCPRVLMALPAAGPAAAIEAQRESSALLLINDHIYDGIVPLKTFDYLCSRRPILVFGRTGGAAKIVTELGAGLAVDAGDCDGFAHALDTLMKTDPAIWDTPQRRAWAARHNRAMLALSMLDAIEALDRRAPATVLSDLGPAQAQPAIRVTQTI